MPRSGTSHIVSFRLGNGNWRTVCGKVLKKELTMTILAADNTYPGLCSSCKSTEDYIYKQELKYNPRIARNCFQNHMCHTVDYIQNGMMSVSENYHFLEKRHWRKLKQYQLLVPRANKNDNRKKRE